MKVHLKCFHILHCYLNFYYKDYNECYQYSSVTILVITNIYISKLIIYALRVLIMKLIIFVTRVQ